MTAPSLSLLAFAAAAAAALLSACAQTAHETPQNQARQNQARLWLVEPTLPRPDGPADSLIDCPARAESAARERLPWATPLAAAAQVQWQGGTFTLPATPGASADPTPLQDRCFALEVDEKLVATGAVLSRHSARLLRFPVLTLMSDPGQPLVFQLTALFPADLATPAPAAWNESLDGLR